MNREFIASRRRHVFHCNNRTTDPVQEQFEDLANAIIVQAVKDYRAALKKLQRNKRSKIANQNKEECEQFFRSAWFGFLTTVDGEMLIRSLNKEEKQL